MKKEANAFCPRNRSSTSQPWAEYSAVALQNCTSASCNDSSYQMSITANASTCTYIVIQYKSPTDSVGCCPRCDYCSDSAVLFDGSDNDDTLPSSLVVTMI